jgi:hypothetical protein
MGLFSRFFGARFGMTMDRIILARHAVEDDTAVVSNLALQ